MTDSIDPTTTIGHVHLKVADLERAIGFWQGVLGFDLMQRMGSQAAFLSAGGYHHHIGLNTWESRGGSPPPRDTTGLYHVAIRYPTRAALARISAPCCSVTGKGIDSATPVTWAVDSLVRRSGRCGSASSRWPGPSRRSTRSPIRTSRRTGCGPRSWSR